MSTKLIFREYIGVKQPAISFDDFPSSIINSPSIEFHFILGFAREEYDGSGKGNGKFTANWDLDYYGPDKVKDFKNKNPNAKVIISIGGRAAETPFNPAEESLWIRNAVNSLRELIGPYKNDSGNIIDGIDINYETIKTSSDLFVRCIGQVITQLKNDQNPRHDHYNLKIHVVSIAVSEKNKSHYRDLYYANRTKIDWVDYQFYNQEKVVSTVKDFVEIYKNLIKDYTFEKILLGISTDPNDTKNSKISLEIFIAGCIELFKNSKVRGVFVWNANDSANPPHGDEPYAVELRLKDALTHGLLTGYV